MRLLLVLLAACGAESAPSVAPPQPEQAPAQVETPEPPRPLTLWIGGDVLLSEALRDYANSFEDPAEGMATIIEPVSRLWNADPDAFVIVNLETPVADERRFAIDAEPVNERGLTAVHLQGPDWLLPGLARAGVDAVTLANNHALDQDREGLAETIAAANRAGLVVTGAGIYPRFVWPLVLGEEDNPVFVLNFYDGRGRGYVEPPDPALSFLEEGSFARVREAAEIGRVVVIVHVLGELVDEPEDEWRVWAGRLAEEGADAIIVHGTHVVMPVETLSLGQRRVPIAWGLGNFVSDMGRLANPTHRGVQPKVRSSLVHEELLARLEIGESIDITYLPMWMHDDRYARWHGALQGELIEFTLFPLSGCDSAVSFDSIVSPYDEQLESWVTNRRQHIVEATGLRLTPCDEAAPSWLVP